MPRLDFVKDFAKLTPISFLCYRLLTKRLVILALALAMPGLSTAMREMMISEPMELGSKECFPMVSRETRLVFLSRVGGLALVMLLIGLFGISSASAYQQPSELAQSESAMVAARQPEPGFTLEFTNPWTPVNILDLNGSFVAVGTQSGSARCNNKCNQRVELSASPPSDFRKTEYKFAVTGAVDPTVRRVTVEGTGTIGEGGMKERFRFTAIFEDNGDGTISATYVASRPDASFFIPSAPGIMVISEPR